MNIKVLVPKLLLFQLGTMAVSCSRNDAQNSEGQEKTETKIVFPVEAVKEKSQQTQDNLHERPSQPVALTSEILKLIVRRPGTEDTAETIAAMELFLAKKNPAGGKIMDLKSDIGQPNRIENGNLVYAFDTGKLHYEWIFHVEGDIISEISQNHMLE